MTLSVEFGVEILLIILLAVTIGYCFVLDRKFKKLRHSQGSFESLLGEFGRATERAATSVETLRTACDELCRELDGKLEAGRSLGDELTQITQSGESVARRIEASVVERPRGTPPSLMEVTNQNADSVVAHRSESERELMNALRAVR